ncbi:MAG: hypothetical protein Aurels2KO_38050 [Aureliella sp.]
MQLGEFCAQNDGPIADHRGAPIEGYIRNFEREYVAYCFPTKRNVNLPQSDSSVVVLFDRQAITSAGWRAALLPLLTGLSTIGLLTTVTWLLTSRIAKRVARLQQRMHLVASGNFEATVDDQSRDEIGQLSKTVDNMSSQLKSLWEKVNRRQSEKLLHQVSAGMAHQLRNTLTGAKLALELHQQANQDKSQEIEVALREMSSAVEYVQRLILVGAGEHHVVAQAGSVKECLREVKASHDLLARHQGAALRWELQSLGEDCSTADTESLRVAVSNLVLNALQAGSQVDVLASVQECKLVTIEISDDGPGVELALQEDLFEPFVTSKPEGMGLGLSVVRRAAQKLGGTIKWTRDAGATKFILQVPLVKELDGDDILKPIE